MLEECYGENKQPIDKVYAVLYRDAEGNDGIVSIRVPGIGVMPLVCSDVKLLPTFRDNAQQLISRTGKKLYICEFSNKKVLEEIGQNLGSCNYKEVKMKYDWVTFFGVLGSVFLVLSLVGLFIPALLSSEENILVIMILFMLITGGVLAVVIEAMKFLFNRRGNK